LKRKLYLIAYDIREPKRLRRVLYVVKDYASGGQKSAYECYLNDREKQELLERLAQVIETGTDSVALIRLLSRDAVDTLGIAVKPRDELYTYLG
jgi:CRISPR-associated protein Cas2